MSSKKEARRVGILFIVVGVVFIIAGIIVMIQGNISEQRCTEKTTGTVVELVIEKSTTSNHRTSYIYFPVIEYQVGDRTISKKSNSGQNPPKYKVGQQVEIYYNPNNVEEYYIKGESAPKFIGILFVVLGSIAVAVGVTVLIKTRKPEEYRSVNPRVFH
ncbi:MAG: DUF3592 domain-containing protein [Eubacterium sp.]|nr:DUF3592 domain-containing protein [Eubacterium sp.]